MQDTDRAYVVSLQCKGNLVVPYARDLYAVLEDVEARYEVTED